jgi:hypothetical protein
MRLAALVPFLAALAACAPRVGPGDGLRTETVAAGDARVRVQFLADDADGAKQVIAAIERALPAAQRWGALRIPVVVTVHPDHEALEGAIHREGYDWLRAWATYATIDVQSPRSWTGRGWSLFGPEQQEIDELVLHELTHCAMYQAAATDWSWPFKEIPLWFREGMASVTASQAYRWKKNEEIARFYTPSLPGSGGGVGARRGVRAEPRRGGDPLTDPEPLYRAESEVVYGTAHLAFEFLVARYGEGKVKAIVATMGEGHLFRTAFERAIGIDADAFEGEFRRYIVWRGWARAG